MAEQTAAEAFQKGYEAIGAVREDMASKDILSSMYAGQTPEEVKDPIKQTATLQSAAGMLQAKGLFSAAYKLQKQAGDLSTSVNKQQLDDLKVKQGMLEYSGQMLATATNEEDLNNAFSNIKDTSAQMNIQRVIGMQAPFEQKKKMLEDMTKSVDQHLKAQQISATTAFKQAQIENMAADNVRADQREARLLSAIGSKDSPKLTGAEVARTQRGINATGNIASSLEALNKFSSGTTTGFLPELTTKKGMTNALTSATVRGLSKDESNEMNTVFTGIGRSLAAVETGGLATGLAELSKKMEEGIYIRPGDKPKAVAGKLADIRRITEESLQPAIDSGMLTPKQEATASKLLERIRTAVPYTTNDVIDATRKPGAKTIKEVSEELIIPKTSSEDASLISKYLKPQKP